MPENVRADRLMAILDASEDLFLNKGYDDTNVEDILALTHLSKGGFYHYFHSKEAVLHAVLERMTDQVIQKITPKINNIPTPVDKLQAFFVLQQTHKLPRAKLIRTLLTKIDAPIVRFDFARKLWLRYTPLLSEIIAAGNKTGDFMNKDAKETADMIMHLMSLLNRPEQHYERDFESLQRSISSVEEAVNMLLNIPKTKHVHIVTTEYLAKIRTL
jgi:AcrR family transcriptional regulator